MSARHTHHEVKKILCDQCKTTATMRINLKSGGNRLVVAHRDICTSEDIEFCCQRVDSGSYSYYASRCGRPVKGHAKGGYSYHSGVPMCGLHLSVERRQLEKYAAEESRREVSAYLRDQMTEKIKLIEELTGIVAQLHHRRGWGTDSYKMYLDNEWILVKADDLIAAIQIEVE